MLKFEVYDWNSSGTPDLIGGFDTTLRKLRSGPGDINTYDVINKVRSFFKDFAKHLKKHSIFTNFVFKREKNTFQPLLKRKHITVGNT